MRVLRRPLVVSGILLLGGLSYVVYLVVVLTGQPPELRPAPAASGPAQPKVNADRSCNGNVQESRLLHKTIPRYPKSERQKCCQDPFVVAEVTISEEGAVEKVDIIRGHPLCDDAVQKTLVQWRYTPTLCNGTPVKLILKVRVPCGRSA